VHRPGCLEHYVLHTLREDPAFVSELAFVMEKCGRVIGQNVFMRAHISVDDGSEIPVLTMGPICITPELMRQDYGKMLLFTIQGEGHTIVLGGGAMPYYLLLCRSVTQAQRMSAALERRGIRSPYFRAPMTLSGRGCSYAVRVSSRQYAFAMSVLQGEALRPTGVFFDSGDGVYQEILRF